MIDTDEFGHDPNIQKARKYFSMMEKMDTRLITQLGLSFFDPKIRVARERRFEFFEKSCFMAARKGIRLDEGGLFELFELCHHVAFQTSGLDVSNRVLAGMATSGNQELLTLVQEARK